MLNEIPKGILMPCPVCGGNNIDWYGYRYISLRCNECRFEMYPSDDFASENEYFKEWNSLGDIDANIESLDKQIEFAQRIADMCAEKKAHYNWTKSRIVKAREDLSHA
jgi:hypothetical protein